MARAVGLALLVVVVLFVTYEIMEGTRLAGTGMERLHAYHRVRGLVSAFLAATLAAWLMLPGSPFAVSGDESAERPEADSQLTSSEREEHFARWFIRLRWIAVTVAVLLVVVAIEVMEYLPRALWPSLAATIAALAALNLIYTGILRTHRATHLLLATQAYADLIFLTVLLHFSGGVENPLSAVMLFHVIIAGILLARRQCYLVAAAASLLFAALVWAEWSRVVPHYTLEVFPHQSEDASTIHAAHELRYVISRVGLQAGVLLLTAYFTATLTAQLRRGERQLELFADRALAQNQLLERALETTGTALCVCDRNLHPTWCNPRWNSLFGDRPATKCGAEPLSRNDPGRRTLEHGQVEVTEVDLPFSGTARTRPEKGQSYLVTTAPLVDKRGQITHVVQLAREITEQKRIQERVIRTEKLAAIGELAGRVAHEVNNPIAILSAKARLLLSDHRHEMSERTAGELIKIVDLSDRVARIAQGLLSYCRPARGPTAPLDVRKPLRRALAIIRPAAEAAGITVEEQLPDGLPDARVNDGEMEQVFMNLFVNALDAMPRGGRLAIVARSDHRDGAGPGILEVTVEDNGCGISPEIRGRVFEPFLTTKPDGQGTGLGLSICLRLLQGNGGTIELESEPGSGTRVMLRFPVEETVERGVAAHV